MKPYLILITLLLIGILLIRNYEISNSSLELKIKSAMDINDNFSSKVLQEKFDEILHSQLLIENLNLSRNTEYFFDLPDDFTFSVYFSKPQFQHIAVKTQLSSSFFQNTSIFNSFKIELNDLWNEKEIISKYDKSGIEFSGYYQNEKGEKVGFLYYFDELLKVSVGDKIGEDQILEVFEDGILILTKEKNLCAIF